MTDARQPRPSPIRLPPNPQAVPSPAPRHILAVSGGGYRGLFTAEVLRLIEARTASEAGLADRFQLFAGTSVGGLIAAGLALGHSPERLRDAIRDHGPSIFDDRFRIAGRAVPIRKAEGHLGGLLGAKFSRAALEDAIDDVLQPTGKDMRVADVTRSLLLVATCVTTQAPFLMSNLEKDTPGSDLPLKSTLIATSAAPGYFPALDLPTRTLVDGGLVANAPELLALSALKRRRWAREKQVRVMSIGTAGRGPAAVPAVVGSRGLLGWLTGDLVPLTLKAQERWSSSRPRICWAKATGASMRRRRPGRPASSRSTERRPRRQPGSRAIPRLLDMLSGRASRIVRRRGTGSPADHAVPTHRTRRLRKSSRCSERSLAAPAGRTGPVRSVGTCSCCSSNAELSR